MSEKVHYKKYLGWIVVLGGGVCYLLLIWVFIVWLTWRGPGSSSMFGPAMVVLLFGGSALIKKGLLILSQVPSVKPLGKPSQSQRKEPIPTESSELTQEEKEILQLLSEDLGNMEIANRLGISIGQVSVTRFSLMKRFKADNLSDLVKKTREEGYLPSN